MTAREKEKVRKAIRLITGDSQHWHDGMEILMELAGLPMPAIPTTRVSLAEAARGRKRKKGEDDPL